ncbi:putative ankyrin repeat protein FPV031 [BeAn 58058 virus]|uniref:putative ankyrin repeat protein FPV031 n=1 Tax=BeAn 58058 virus TaxID=67082 RepID=UPI00090A5F87|nr:putative ankyrin repeat protein FPV031 [BeAn 58058 virus]APG58194.1 putative ankyrin repeat protein FPV031 [BeAn 58058 virus]
MNKCILYKSITMVDLLNCNIDTLTRYSNNFTLIKTVEKLTVYKNLFTRRLRKANSRKYLLDRAINYFGYLVDDWDVLPIEIKSKIFSYFNKKDLNYLLK